MIRRKRKSGSGLYDDQEQCKEVDEQEQAVTAIRTMLFLPPILLLPALLPAPEAHPGSVQNIDP